MTVQKECPMRNVYVWGMRGGFEEWPFIFVCSVLVKRDLTTEEQPRLDVFYVYS